ncbi:MAG: hypothetical protein [Siphoviridae sp. ct7UA22]|nr:MAG: hypothetical protein [Siphoviridae sp. ct7UA22]
MKKGYMSKALAAVNDTLAMDVGAYESLSFYIAGTFTTLGLAFEASPNSTNGVDGNWYAIAANRTVNGMSEAGLSNTSAVPQYGWSVPLAGAGWFRVRCTAIASGSVTVMAMPSYNSAGFTGIVINGPTAHDGAITGSPVRVAGKSVTTLPAAVSAASDVTDISLTMQGAVITSTHVAPSARLRNTLLLTTTTDTSLFAAAGAGNVNNLVDLHCINVGASAVDLIIKDGSTVIWQLPLPPNVPVLLDWDLPIRGTANTVVNVALSAASTGVRVNATGFVSV